jgi:membrane-associated protease RseP (regulator of RpoE activity)
MGALVIVIGVILMIVIHEMAHFVAAKSFGMKATEAFFGFGPRIWSIRRGETEYGIKAIPLGGYVRIIGMNMFEEVDEADLGRTYREAPFWKKSVVVLAGIVSHFIVAFGIFYLLATAFGIPTLTTNIGGISQTLADGTTPTPASRSGIEVGDRLVAFDGVAVSEWETFVEMAHARPGETVTVEVVRDGEPVVIETTLAVQENVAGEDIGFFGVSPAVVDVREGPIAAVGTAASDLWFATRENVRGLGELVTNFGSYLGAVFGADSEVLDRVRPVSVIGLTQIGQEASRTSGIAATLGLIAWVNVFVGLLNVVPLYPLDGGHFAVALYEKARGRAPDVRKLLPVAAAVFLFIVLLGLLGVYFDIVNPISLTE